MTNATATTTNRQLGGSSGIGLSTAQRLGAAVLFLASDQSSFITGTELFVDGGQSDLKVPSQFPAAAR